MGEFNFAYELPAVMAHSTLVYWGIAAPVDVVVGIDKAEDPLPVMLVGFAIIAKVGIAAGLIVTLNVVPVNPEEAKDTEPVVVPVTAPLPRATVNVADASASPLVVAVADEPAVPPLAATVKLPVTLAVIDTLDTPVVPLAGRALTVTVAEVVPPTVNEFAV